MISAICINKSELIKKHFLNGCRGLRERKMIFIHNSALLSEIRGEKLVATIYGVPCEDCYMSICTEHGDEDRDTTATYLDFQNILSDICIGYRIIGSDKVLFVYTYARPGIDRDRQIYWYEDRHHGDAIWATRWSNITVYASIVLLRDIACPAVVNYEFMRRRYELSVEDIGDWPDDESIEV